MKKKYSKIILMTGKYKKNRSGCERFFLISYNGSIIGLHCNCAQPIDIFLQPPVIGSMQSINPPVMLLSCFLFSFFPFGKS